MKTIRFFPADDSLRYPGAGWALARIDNDTVVEVHQLIGGGAPPGLSLDAEAEWFLERCADFAATPGPGAIFYGMVSCYEFCDPRPFTLDLLPTIGRQICEELSEYE